MSPRAGSHAVGAGSCCRSRCRSRSWRAESRRTARACDVRGGPASRDGVNGRRQQRPQRRGPQQLQLQLQLRLRLRLRLWLRQRLRLRLEQRQRALPRPWRRCRGPPAAARSRPVGHAAQRAVLPVRSVRRPTHRCGSAPWCCPDPFLPPARRILDIADLAREGGTLSCPDCPLKLSLGAQRRLGPAPRQCAVCPTRCARAESNTPVSVTIPMEGIKHRPDDGLSASKRDEDLPTIQEECPSCSNDLACAQPPSSPPAPARKCSPEGLVAPADTTAPCSCAPQTRGRPSFTRVPRAVGNGSKTASRGLGSMYRRDRRLDLPRLDHASSSARRRSSTPLAGDTVPLCAAPSPAVHPAACEIELLELC